MLIHALPAATGWRSHRGARPSAGGRFGGLHLNALAADATLLAEVRHLRRIQSGQVGAATAERV